MKTMLGMLFFCALSISVFAQDAAKNNRAMMKKVDWGLGKWEGNGWIESSSGGQLTYTSTTTVQSKLNGAIFLFEGQSQFQPQGGDGKAVKTSQLSILSYDPKKDRYCLRSYGGDGADGVDEMKYEDHTFRWEKHNEERGVDQRFTMRLDDEGRLIYSGESSYDQKTWRKFFHAEYRLLKNAAQ